MAYRDFPHFGASLWSGENSIGPRTFRSAKSRVSKTYTKYFYDARGNVKKVATGLTVANITESAIPEGAHVTEYSYHKYLNKATSVTLPDGTEQYYDYNYWGLVEEQGYERDGERYGKVINTYNTIGELLKQTAEDGKENVYEYNMLGQLSKVEDESGVRLYSYNDRGLLSTEYSLSLIHI